MDCRPALDLDPKAPPCIALHKDEKSMAGWHLDLQAWNASGLGGSWESSGTQNPGT